MPRPQEVRPGAKVPRSGIYQDRLSQRRATLVQGEPAPPTPGKASCWQQVVDTASAPAPRARPWTLLSGVVLGASLMLWVRSAPTGHEPWPHSAARSRSGGVLAFCAGVVAGERRRPVVLTVVPLPHQGWGNGGIPMYCMLISFPKGVSSLYT
jgi:hypothetical protein